MTTEPLLLRAKDRVFAFHYDEWDRPLFVALGAALAEAQALEFHLSHMLALAADGAEAEYDSLVAGFFEKTLGQLAKYLREQCADDETARVLDQLVERRNYLVHRILREYKWPMSSIEEYAQAIRELDEIAKCMRSGSEVVTLALKRTKNLQVWLIKSNPRTGQPEIIE